MPNDPLIVALRTHFWRADVEILARRLRYFSQGLEMVVLADETGGQVPAKDFRKLAHTQDFAAFGLPAFPGGQVMWYNADYPLYALRDAYPAATHFAMVEYDVAVNVSVTNILRDAQARNIDLIAHGIRDAPEDWMWTRGGARHFPRPMQALMPFLVVSARLIDALLAKRRAILAAGPPRETEDWPFCETLIPSVAIELENPVIAELSTYARLPRFWFTDEQHLLDPAVQELGTMFHPVVGSETFIQRRIEREHGACIFDPASLLRRNLPLCDPAVFAPMLYGRIHATGSREKWDALLALAAAHGWPPPANHHNLARFKPTLMSSIWPEDPGADLASSSRGGNNGQITGGFGFHTALEFDPWWQVDLETTAEVAQVVVYNRMIFSERCRRMFVSGSPDGITWSPLAYKLDPATFGGADGNPYRFTFNPPVPARFIRITLLGEGILHLDEVEVYGLAGA